MPDPSLSTRRSSPDATAEERDEYCLREEVRRSRGSEGSTFERCGNPTQSSVSGKRGRTSFDLPRAAGSPPVFLPRCTFMHLPHPCFRSRLSTLSWERAVIEENVVEMPRDGGASLMRAFLSFCSLSSFLRRVCVCLSGHARERWWEKTTVGTLRGRGGGISPLAPEKKRTKEKGGKGDGASNISGAQCN